MERIDQYTKIENYTGKNFGDLPYNLRVELYQKLTPEDYKKFERGFANDDIIGKAQSIMESWYEESSPTDAKIMERVMEARSRDMIYNLKRQLEYAQTRLEKLNRMAERDEVLPVGARQQLKAEIDQLKRELQVTEIATDIKADEVNPDDWIDSLFD